MKLGLGLGLAQTPDSLVPANALRGDNGVPILNDDGTYILVS